MLGRMRAIDRDLIREGHYGQRSWEPRKQAEHMAAPTNAAYVQESPCQLGAVHTWGVSGQRVGHRYRLSLWRNDFLNISGSAAARKNAPGINVEERKPRGAKKAPQCRP